MRAACLVSLTLLAGLASAERQFYIPTARKLTLGTVKYEIRYDTRDFTTEQYVGFGATPFWEIELTSRDNRHGTFDLTYNLISPFTDLAPGIAFGMQDVLDETPQGRRIFAVTTFRNGAYAIDGEQPADVTLGIMYRERRLTPFVGVRLPFSEQFRLVAEHDGQGLAAGVEVQPLRPLALKFLIRENRGLLGLSLQHRF